MELHFKIIQRVKPKIPALTKFVALNSQKHICTPNIYRRFPSEIETFVYPIFNWIQSNEHVSSADNRILNLRFDMINDGSKK